jgi:predicted metal-dependent hydrolase
MARQSVEKRHFSGNGLSFDYVWTKKSVKNYNLRVKAGGEVLVSTPARITAAQVERFLADKAEFLHRALARVQARDAQPIYTLAAGEQIPILGVLHTVCHERATRPHVFCADGRLVLALPDPADAQARGRAFARFLKRESAALLDTMTAACAPRILPADHPLPKVTVRDMKSRWGSCFYTQNRITYSTRLLFLPRACAELVVCHELTHFLHRDHSAAFYAALARVLPRHRELKLALRDTPIPQFLFK